jgi:hypothetical protein
MDKVCGDWRVTVSPPSPSWVEIFYRGESLCRCDIKEVTDLCYLLKMAGGRL